MAEQGNLFDYAMNKMRERGVFRFYGDKKKPKDAIDAGARSLSSAKATQLRSMAFSGKDTLDKLNSPTYCKDVDAYVPFWWAVMHYPESMFSDWDRRINMAASLQKQQYVFQTTAQLFLNGAVEYETGQLVDPEYYMDLGTENA